MKYNDKSLISTHLVDPGVPDIPRHFSTTIVKDIYEQGLQYTKQQTAQESHVYHRILIYQHPAYAKTEE